MTRLRNYRRPPNAATIRPVGALTPIGGRAIIAIFMFRARLRLHHRIVLPVVLVAVVTTTLTAVLALSLIRSALQARVVSRLRTTATAMRQSDLFLNPAILARLAEVTGTDIVAFGDDGAVVTSTVDRVQHPALLSAIRPDTAVRAATATDILVRDRKSTRLNSSHT